MTLLKSLCRPLLERFSADRRGSVVVELAFAVPVGLIIVLGCYDTARYVLLHQKIDRAASTMADLVAQPETFDPDTGMTPLYPAATRLLQPFDLPGRGLVIVSEILGEAGNTPRIIWQRQGGGTLVASSEIGSQGSVADLPEAFTTIRDGETMVIAEVFYDFEPMFIDYILPAKVVAHQSYRRPRQR